MYLLHFDRPYHHARHYVGFTTNLDQRVERHRAGRGSPLVQAASEAGIAFKVVRVWYNVTAQFERRVHHMQKKLLCPVCTGGSQIRPVRPRIADYQEVEDLYPENSDYDGHWEYQPPGSLAPITQIELATQLTQLGPLTRDLLAEEASREREEAEYQAYLDQIQEWPEADTVAEADDQGDDAGEYAE